MKIGYKLTCIFLIITLAITLFYYFLGVRNQNEHLAEIQGGKIKELRASFFNLEERDAKILLSTLEVIVQDSNFKAIYLANDREKLYKYGQRLFQDLKNKYGITHFYFILPDGRVFLRLHEKEINGDQVNRLSFQKARDTKSPAWEIELGKTAFALRAVMPYYNAGKLIGYVELGEEIDHFLNIIKGITNSELAIIADKKYLERDDWKSVRQVKKLRGNWDDLQNHLILSSTSEDEIAMKCFTEDNLEHVEKGESILNRLHGNNQTFMCGGFDLNDAGGRHIGAVLSLIPMSEHIAVARKANNAILRASIIIFLLTFITIVLVSRSIAKPLSELALATKAVGGGDLDHTVNVNRRDEIGQLANSFNKMTGDLKKRKDELERINSELTVLHVISTEAGSTMQLDELFTNILNAVTNYEILKVAQKGVIFIIDGERMNLVAQRGFTESFENAHKNVKVGDCLCGLAAETEQVTVSMNSETDSRHTIIYPGIVPHAHICIPLVARHRILGVLCLYPPSGTEISDRELALFYTIGSRIGAAIDNMLLYEETKTLSLHDPLTGLANRRLMEYVLETSYARAKRAECPFSAIMLDIDFFKSYNDTYGHTVGDNLLVNIAKIISGEIRQIDLGVRYGGEEFLILLPETELTEACEVAERIRKDVETKMGVTVSLGVSCYNHKMQKKEDIISSADDALLEAKRKGRNRVEISV
ncbi:MAG: diguanylate cyclase [Nitrospiraceae bacterium]|nr:MAG: diguanylate cyclase [Nitrospiraceae bacterium]